VKWVGQLLFENAFAKVLVPALFGIISNVLAGTYVFEITKTEGGKTFLAWRESPNTLSLWAIVGLLVLMVFYGIKLVRREKVVSQDSRVWTQNYIADQVFKETIPELISRVNKDTVQGNLRTVKDVYELLHINKP
jgi:hypothetical protein